MCVQHRARRRGGVSGAEGFGARVSSSGGKRALKLSVLLGRQEAATGADDADRAVRELEQHTRHLRHEVAKAGGVGHRAHEATLAHVQPLEHLPPGRPRGVLLAIAYPCVCVCGLACSTASCGALSMSSPALVRSQLNPCSGSVGVQLPSRNLSTTSGAAGTAGALGACVSFSTRSAFSTHVVASMRRAAH